MLAFSVHRIFTGICTINTVYSFFLGYEFLKSSVTSSNMYSPFCFCLLFFALFYAHSFEKENTMKVLKTWTFYFVSMSRFNEEISVVFSLRNYNGFLENLLDSVIHSKKTKRFILTSKLCNRVNIYCECVYFFYSIKVYVKLSISDLLFLIAIEGVHKSTGHVCWIM